VFNIINLSFTRQYKKNLLIFINFVSFEELFCFAKTIISQSLSIYVDI